MKANNIFNFSPLYGCILCRSYETNKLLCLMSCVTTIYMHRRSADVGVMVGHRLRRWPNIKPTSAERLVFAVILLK